MSDDTSGFARDAVTAEAIRATNMRRRERNTLRGFVDLALEPSGLTLHGSYHCRGDTRWIRLPARPQLDHKGRLLRTPKTGKPSYAAIITIDNRETRARFQAKELAAIDELLGRAS